MTVKAIRYSEDHWLRSRDSEKAVSACMEQQSKAYSRIKTGYVLELLGCLDSLRFLDYGCGAGLFVVLGAKAGAARIVGVDAEDGALSTARYFAHREGVAERCHFIRCRRFPSFPPGTRFDAVLMKDVIEHVEDDQALLDAAAEALAPGGIIVLSTQNAVSLNYAIESTYHRIIRNERDWCGWDPTHLRFYTPRTLERLLKNAGFRSVDWRSVYIVPYKLPPLPFSNGRFFRIDCLSMVDRALGRRFPFNRIGWNVIIKAVKS